MAATVDFKILGYHATEVRVPFGFIDGYGYLWHGHALNFFENARADMVREFKLTAKDFLNEDLAVPMVDLKVSFKTPAYDDELLIIYSTLKKPAIALPCLYFDYRLVRQSDRKLILHGETHQLITRVSDNRPLIRMPPVIKQRLQSVWLFLANSSISVEDQS